MKFQVVVPSRGRSGLMPGLLTMVPYANVLVHESEYDDYQEVVPDGQLHTHNEGLVADIRNHILRNFGGECVIMMDDDFIGVRPLISKLGLIKDPDYIHQLLYNSMMVCGDLGCSVFAYAPVINPIIMRPEVDPIKLNNTAFRTFGVMGEGLKRRFPSQGRADIDFSMQTLRDDRIIYVDCRFYFDHGNAGTGKGGSVGSVGAERRAKAVQDLKSRWGNNLGLGGRNAATKSVNQSMSIKVSRRNKLVNVREYFPEEFS